MVKVLFVRVMKFKILLRKAQIDPIERNSPPMHVRISYVYKPLQKGRIAMVSARDQLYNSFLDQLSKFRDDEWHLVLFEGSPTENSYSWCPDCVFALDEVKKFKSTYGGPVHFLQFKVGSKEEWSSDSPFETKFPNLTDLPTAVLLRGQIDTMRVIAVEQKDLLYLCERSQEYERQIQSGAWSPPKIRRVQLAQR